MTVKASSVHGMSPPKKKLSHVLDMIELMERWKFEKGGETTLPMPLKHGKIVAPAHECVLYIYALLDSSLKIIRTLVWEPVNIYWPPGNRVGGAKSNFRTCYTRRCDAICGCFCKCVKVFVCLHTYVCMCSIS